MELFNPYFYAANIDLLAYENAWIQYMESGEKNVPAFVHHPEPGT